MSDAFITVAGLNKFYNVAGNRLHVLRDLDLTVQKGEMVAIMGASGVGKSTLLHVMGGLDTIDGGRVQVGEHDITTMNDEARVAFRNRHIGFVFQFHHLLPEFTAVENAMMPLRIARVSAADARPTAEALLARVGLGDRLDHRPGMLSGGEQQRVAVSRALVMQPSLLLADEPTGDLAAVDRVEASEHMQQRALPHPGRAHDRHHLALLDGQVEIAQHVQPFAGRCCVVLVQAVDGNECHCATRSEAPGRDRGAPPGATGRVSPGNRRRSRRSRPPQNPPATA